MKVQGPTLTTRVVGLFMIGSRGQPPTEPPVIVNPTVPESTDAHEPTDPGDLENPEIPEVTEPPAPEVTEPAPEEPQFTAPPFVPPRFTLDADVDCAGPRVTFSYDDLVDGHVPQTVHELVGSGGHGDFGWISTEVHQVNGDYFNSHTFPMAGQSIPSNRFYEYIVTISYEDGVELMDGLTVNLNDVCPAQATGPQVLSGTLPETGANATTWVIGTIAALLLGAGATFMVGTRRSGTS